MFRGNTPRGVTSEQGHRNVPKQVKRAKAAVAEVVKKIIYHLEIESRAVFKRLILQILSTISNGKIIAVKIPIN